MGEKLKPCPFCGSRDVDVFDAAGEPYGCSQPYVHCNNCCADSKMCDSLDKAVAAWNRRAIDVDAIKDVIVDIGYCCYTHPQIYRSVEDVCRSARNNNERFEKRLRKAVYR